MLTVIVEPVILAPISFVISCHDTDPIAPKSPVLAATPPAAPTKKVSAEALASTVSAVSVESSITALNLFFILSIVTPAPTVESLPPAFTPTTAAADTIVEPFLSFCNPFPVSLLFFAL